MSGIGVAEGMEVYLFGYGSLFEVFPHYPGQAPDALPAPRLLPVEEPDMGIFGLQVFL